MPDVLIREVPAGALAALKARAASHHRSLQGELRALLEQAAAETPSRTPAAVAARIRAALSASGSSFTDSTGLIRSDRAR